MDQIPWLPLFACLNASVLFNDLRMRRVPNYLIIALGAFQFFFLLLPTAYDSKGVSYLSTNWGLSLLGMLIGLMIFFPLWRFRAMGAGDVKFIAILGFCLGPSGMIAAVLIGSVLAGVYALTTVGIQGWPNARAIWKDLPDNRRGVPYAAYIALGALFGMGWLMFHPEPWLSSL